MRTTNGKFVRELCDFPLAVNISISFNSDREGLRLISWRADKPSALYWAETQDGGDAKVEISPRNIIYTQPVEAVESEEPEILHKLDFCFSIVTEVFLGVMTYWL